MTAQPLDLSVVVPTRDRPERLAACLASIAELDPRPAEVIVVDSASECPVAPPTARGSWTVLRCDVAGASRARNVGWRAATGSIVAFLDDDVRVSRGWADRICAPLVDADVVFVSGALLPGDAFGSASGRDRPVATTEDVRAGSIDRRALGNVGASANLAVRRSALELVGGFDELLGAGAQYRAAEDLDLFDRLLAHGSGWHARDAVAFHDQWRGRRQLLRLEVAYGVGYGVRLSKVLRSTRWRGRALARYEAARLLRDLAHDVRHGYGFGVATRTAWAGAALVGWARGRRVPMVDGHLAHR